MITEQLSTQQTVIPEVFQEAQQQAEPVIQQQEFPAPDVQHIRLQVYQQLPAQVIQLREDQQRLVQAIPPLEDQPHQEPAIQHHKALQQRPVQAIQQAPLLLVQAVVQVRHHQITLIALRVLQAPLLIQVDRAITLAVAVQAQVQVAQAVAVAPVAAQEVLAEAEEEDNYLYAGLNTKVVRFKTLTI